MLIGDGGDGFSYDRLNRAFRLALDGAPLIALGTNRNFREADGLSLDLGPFVVALEYAAGTRATIVGKPSPAFFRLAAEALGCKRERVVMIGDDHEADVPGARAAGLQAILVKTGKFRPGDEREPLARGARVADDVERAVAELLGDR